jgi:hypothetical protein
VINRIWTGHRALAIAVGAIAVVAILVASLLLAAMPGGTGQATQTPTATASPTASPTAVPTPSPTATPTPEPTPTPTDTPVPTPESLPPDWAYADLDGVAAPATLAHRLPLAIMIDDHQLARPQSGISSASIVYRAPVEGDADRYMYVFQEGTATDIGPVRSARPYYVYWADEYKALFGHYGGDAQSLLKIIPANAKYIYNMDALNAGSCPYHRITTRPGPHNAYTNSAALIACLPKRGYPSTFQNLPTRPFKDDLPFDARPASQTISIAYPSGAVGYQYDIGSDAYVRLIGGKPEIDPANRQYVFARSIVVMYQVDTIDPHSEPGHARPDVINVGSGKAIVFQEGTAIIGTWKKTSTTALTRFYDSTGNEIELVRGEIFIQSVPPTWAVTIK